MCTCSSHNLFVHKIYSVYSCCMKSGDPADLVMKLVNLWLLSCVGVLFEKADSFSNQEKLVNFGCVPFMFVGGR